MERQPLDYSPTAPSPRRANTWVAIALLVVAMVVLLEGLCASGAFQTPSQRRRVAAFNDLVDLRRGVETFRSDCGRYPTAAEGLQALTAAPPELPGWRGPYTKARLDPWGRAYEYVPPPPDGTDVYKVISVGPDGQRGTSDDLSFPGSP
jgi:general secretion pathway protein G